MSIRLSLLAILDLGPSYGYQLRAEFDRRTGSSWPLNAGQIYSTLDRLERDGLVRRADIDAEGQVYFEITDAGRAAAHAWLASPVERVVARDELAMKLAVAVTIPGVDIAQVLEVQRLATRAMLRQLTARQASTAPASVEQLAALLVLDSLVLAAEAELRWLDQSQARLARALAAGLATPLPLSTAMPKRGRPFKAPAAIL